MSAQIDVVYSLARMCARGSRQLSFVNELLSWKTVSGRVVRVPGGNVTMVYGASELQRASWKNLRMRLTQAGFIVKIVYPDFSPSQGHIVDVVSITLDHPARH